MVQKIKQGFYLYEDFSVADENKQPYSFDIERHTGIDDLHAKVKNGEFQLNSIGNRFIAKTPALSEFRVEFKFGFNMLYEFDPNFNVIFHYNKKTRQGTGLRFIYDLSHKMHIAYIAVDKMNIEVIEEITIDELLVEEDKRYALSIDVKGGKLSGEVEDKKFEFSVDAGNGYIAIERKNFIGQMFIKDFALTGYDEMNVTELGGKISVDIPLLNGGDIPYVLTWQFKKINEVVYMDYSLSGGTASRKVDRDDRPGQYVAERDRLTSPYIQLKTTDKEKKIYIFNGPQMIIDPNIYWECLKEYWKMPEFPVKRRVQIPENMLYKLETVTYGYEDFLASGYMMQSMGANEFVYDKNGKLLYEGPILGESIYELCSPHDKKAVSFVSDNCYNKDEVITHLKNNHYFTIDEKINFTFFMRTKLNTDGIKINAEIRDIFDREVISEFTPELIVSEWKFGYKEISVDITNGCMPERLYRAVFLIYYGGKLVDTYSRVFEVFDTNTKVSPAVASGLPYVFSMPNEQKWLSRNSFDLWNPLSSCDVEHYISCVTDTPIEAERKKVWEAIKPFKREWFVWLEARTCRDWENGHPDCIKFSDYIYYPAPVELYPLRNDLYKLKAYTYNADFRSILRDFLEENPKIKEQLSFTLPDAENDKENIRMLVDETGINRAVDVITEENLKELLDLCHVEWFDFVTKRLRENIRKQNEEFKKINPNFKRSAYGPFNQYVNPTLSYHTIKSYGMIPDETLAKDVYTGFAVYEDYPYSCAYQTYRGVFGLMTSLLHVPELVIYPEQYKGGFGGCIDGAVKFSHAPMGAYTMQPYQNSTHAFEFVFNSPQRTSQGYKYWNTYGFHRPDYSAEFWDKLTKDWKYVIDYKPKKPLKTVGFIAEYTDEEDILDVDIDTLEKSAALKNRSEDSHGILYDHCREAGLNAGFAMKFETLEFLSAEETDILIVPTLKNAGENVVKQLRRLYNEGVALVAVSDVIGLEDIFGVSEHKRNINVDTLIYDDETEFVFPKYTELYYDVNDAEVILFANNEPLILKKERAVLINANLADIGFECFEGTAGKGRKNISELIKHVLESILSNLTNQYAIGENVGITLFETEKKQTVLMAIDYSRFDNSSKGEKTAVVSIDMNEVKDVKSDREIICVRDKAGNLCELRFKILPYETVFVELIK